MPATGKRIKVRYRGDNMYITVFPEKKEVFISKIENHDDTNNDITMSGIDTIARLTSKCWQAYDLKTVIEQLDRASRVKSDMPSVLSTVLKDVKIKKPKQNEVIEQ